MYDSATPNASFLQVILDALPMPLFVVDNEYRLVDWNPAANELVGDRASPAALRLCGDSLGCMRAAQTPEGCGTGPACTECVLRQAVGQALNKQTVVRQRSNFLKQVDGEPATRNMLITAIPLEPFSQDLVLLLLEDVTELDALREMVPICASCKKIRNDQNYWEQLEAFMLRSTGMVFSHGLCPDCAQDLIDDQD